MAREGPGIQARAAGSSLDWPATVVQNLECGEVTGMTRSPRTASPTQRAAPRPVGRRRSVRELSGGLVEKAFHAEGWRRWKDPLRAWREARTLRRLRAHGVAVPEPRGWGLREGRWILRMEQVPSAQTLLEVLETGRLTPALRRSLGTLGAQLLRAGVSHPDLHPGNVLLDGEGRAWLIDVARTRCTGKATPGGLEELLCQAARALRELSPARERAALVAALRRELGRASWSLTTSLTDLEQRAREERRKRARRLEERWHRSSSVCDPRPRGLRTRRPAPGPWIRTAPLRPGEATVWWSALARLTEQKVPAARPVLLWEDRRGPRLVRAWPKAAEVLVGPADPGTLGTLLGTLHDRGLQVCWSPETSLLADPRGSLSFDRCILLEGAPTESFDFPQELRQGWAPEDGETFALHYARAHQGGVAEFRRARSLALRVAAP